MPFPHRHWTLNIHFHPSSVLLALRFPKEANSKVLILSELVPSNVEGVEGPNFSPWFRYIYAIRYTQYEIRINAKSVFCL